MFTKIAGRPPGGAAWESDRTSSSWGQGSGAGRRPRARQGAGRGHPDRPAELHHLPAAAVPGGHLGPERRRRGPSDQGAVPPPAQPARATGRGHGCRLGPARGAAGRRPRGALRPPGGGRGRRGHLVRRARRRRARHAPLHARRRDQPAQPRARAVRGRRRRARAHRPRRAQLRGGRRRAHRRRDGGRPGRAVQRGVPARLPQPGRGPGPGRAGRGPRRAAGPLPRPRRSGPPSIPSGPGRSRCGSTRPWPR